MKMKKLNIFLGAVLLVMAACIAYFFLGTNLKVDAAAAREDGGIRCELTLSNGSLFNYEYIELIPLAPEGVTLSGATIPGGDIGRLTQRRETVIITGAQDEPVKLEIGYYVLGMRKAATLTVQ